MEDRSGERMRSDMAEQAVWLRTVPARRAALAQALVPALSARAGAVQACRSADPGQRPMPRLWTLARGSSAHAAAMVHPWLSQATGRPVGALGVDTVLGEPPVLPVSGDVVVVLSQSGQTPDVVAAARRLVRIGTHVVAVVNERGALSEEASAVVELGTGAELAIPATKSVLAQVALLWTLGVVLAEHAGRPADPVGPDTAAAVEWALADTEPVDRAVELLVATPPVAGTGRGASAALAAEWAHKTMETSGLPIFSASAAEFAHGPVAIAAPGCSVVGFAAGRTGQSSVRDVLERAAARGARTVLVAPDGEVSVPDRPVDGLLAGLVRAQTLAERLARARGLDPDVAFGLSKVTSTH